MHHALAVRVLGVAIIALSAGGATMSYFSGRSRTQEASARNRVAAAAQAVEAWYQDPFGGHGSYRGLTTHALVEEAPAVSPTVHATVLAGGLAFCLDDEEGSRSAYFVGGDAGKVANLNGATPYKVTLVRSATTTAAAVCANAS